MSALRHDPNGPQQPETRCIDCKLPRPAHLQSTVSKSEFSARSLYFRSDDGNGLELSQRLGSTRAARGKQRVGQQRLIVVSA